MTDTDYGRDQLRPDFRTGLTALEEAVEERVPPIDTDVRVIGEHGTNVIVRLGIWPTDKYRRAGIEYIPDEHTVYTHIPERFPTGGGKGLIASPPLNRNDRELVNNPWQQEIAQVVEQQTGRDAESYSYNWENTTMNSPGDMVKFLDVADEFLSRG